jgi:hypothetical protein
MDVKKHALAIRTDSEYGGVMTLMDTLPVILLLKSGVHVSLKRVLGLVRHLLLIQILYNDN